MSIKPVYSVGDRGPSGGVIIYNKDKYSDDWNYIEAADSDLWHFFIEKNKSYTKRSFANKKAGVDKDDDESANRESLLKDNTLFCNGIFRMGEPTEGTVDSYIYNDDTLKTGSGKVNTELILKNAYSCSSEYLGLFPNAALFCNLLDYRGFNDWVLPSWGDLIAMFKFWSELKLSLDYPIYLSSSYLDPKHVCVSCFSNVFTSNSPQKDIKEIEDEYLNKIITSSSMVVGRVRPVRYF